MFTVEWGLKQSTFRERLLLARDAAHSTEYSVTAVENKTRWNSLDIFSFQVLSGLFGFKTLLITRMCADIFGFLKELLLLGFQKVNMNDFDS